MYHIKVLGVEDYYLTTLLLRHVREIVEEMGISGKIELIHDVNELMASGISAVPALMIDDQLIFQRMVPQKETLKLLIQCLLAPMNHAKDMHLQVFSRKELSSDQKVTISKNIAQCIPAVELDGFVTANAERFPERPFLYLPGDEFPPHLDNMLYPLVHKGEHSNTLSKLLNLADTNGATLHLASITEHPENSYAYKQLPISRKSPLSSQMPIQLQLTEIQTPNYLTALHNYSNEQAIDLLMLANGSKDVSEKPTLLKKALAILNASTVPLMFL